MKNTNWKKTTLSMIACLAMVLALLPAVAMAAENTCSTHSEAYNNGFCPNGCYESASLVNGYYEITNAGQLYWFAAQVNGGNNSINGKLTADIVVNTGDVAGCNGTKAEGWRDWTPIGTNYTSAYAGTFDGGSYTISGLYFNDSTADYVGLFGYVKLGGQVQNVGVVNSYFSGKDFVGAIAGYNDGAVQNCYNTGTVTSNTSVGGVVGTNGSDGYICNCYNTGTVSGTQDVGGVVGLQYGGNICNCYNTGTVSGNTKVGGVVGHTAGFIRTSYNIGTVVGRGDVGGVVGYYDGGGTINFCYYFTGCAKDINGNAQNGIGNSNDEGVTACADFSTGEVAYRLRDFDENTGGGFPSGNWGQDIGTDASPVLGGNQVYYGYLSCASDAERVYTNDNRASNTKPGHTGGAATCTEKAACAVCGTKYGELNASNHASTDYTNGFRDCCGDYQAAVLNNDYYEISNAGQLYWFATQVNGGNNSINGKLTADIVVSTGDVAGCNGTKAGGWRDWTPIGTNYTSAYAGTFDGGSHTISGLYFNDSTVDNVGLFGYVKLGGQVQDLGVVNSYFSGKASVGAIVGYNDGAVQNCYNTGTVTSNTSVGGVVGTNGSDGYICNCYNTGTVSGSAKVGGVVGSNANGHIINCYNTGAVTGSLYAVGGVAGEASSFIQNCYNIGTVVGSDNVGGVVGEHLDDLRYITNCYYLTGCAKDTNDEETPQFGIGGTTEDEAVVTTGYADFSTGEVAYLLWEYDEDLVPDYDAVWGQAIGTENYPVFGGETVYYGYTSCAPDAEMAYTNDENVSDTRPGHTGGTATCTTPAVCDNCGVSYGEKDTTNHDSAGSFDENGFCPNGCYESAVLNDEGVYEIDNAGKLYWFAAQVNGGIANINAILTTDIVINQNVLVDGALNPDNANFRPWETTIGYSYSEEIGHEIVTYEYPYNGIFDGNGHSISGLYYNDESGFDIALFGYIGEGSTVKDLTLKDTYIAGYRYLASLAAENYGTISGCTTEGVVKVVKLAAAGIVAVNCGTVVDCHNKATVNGSDGAYWFGGIAVRNRGTIDGCHNSGDVDGSHGSHVGGIAYINDRGGTIRNSHNSGTLTGSEHVGGIVSQNQSSSGNVSRGVIENCYNTGTINCTDKTVGGIASHNWGLVKNCFNFGEGASVLAYHTSDDDCEFVNCYYLSDSETDSFDETTAKTTERFNSGEVAYLLGEAFGQTIGADTHPVFGGAKVYYGYTTCGASQTDPIYTNDSSASADKPGHSNSDATCDAPKTCTECGATEGEKLGHIDEDTDHKCDRNCGKTDIGAHVDSDKNHECDYGCETAIGAHADSETDDDHVCDYGCGAVLENCADVTGDNNHTCDVCGAESITEHDWDDATCEAPKTCTECGATEGEKLGHAWTVTYTWSEDGKSCTAKRTCGNDASHNKTATATVTSEVTKAPTYTEKGETTYTATFAVDWAETQTKTFADIPVVEPEPEPTPIPTPIPTPEPEPEEKTVTVSVTNEEITVEVKVTVTEGKATVKDVDVEELDSIMDGDTDTVTINFSELDEKITEVELPREVIEKIAEAAGESEQALKIVLSGGLSIEFNASTLNEQVHKTDGTSLTISILSRNDARLTPAQQAAVGDRPAYDVSLTSGGRVISGMGDRITVTVPYELRNGEKADGLVVCYVDENGGRERCDTRYDAKNKRLSWQTDHLSLYMVDYDASATEACDGGEDCPITAFTDAKPGAWYHDGVHFCVATKLMNGVSDGTRFAPGGSTTRAQFITTLWRLEGMPVVNYLLQFEDVAAEAWYTEAIRWAASEKIMGGYGNGKFGTEDAITREQMVATLYRYCQKKGIDVSVGEDTNILSYTDAFDISEYAIPAMQWACGSGVIGGIPDGGDMRLAPTGSATRAQIATILWRFCTEIMEH